MTHLTHGPSRSGRRRSAPSAAPLPYLSGRSISFFTISPFAAGYATCSTDVRRPDSPPVSLHPLPEAYPPSQLVDRVNGHNIYVTAQTRVLAGLERLGAIVYLMVVDGLYEYRRGR